MAPDEVVNRFIAAIEALDVDAAMAFVADDISYENMPIQPIAGRDAVAQTLQGFLAPASAVEWRVLDQWTVGRTVINERVDRFQIGDGWLELPVAGFFRVDDDDRIVLWRDYFDMGAYVQQLSALTG
ncbi:MAG: limonene-1,2-epoxide hydrolase family protein [Actinomycetota bacterium]